MNKHTNTRAPEFPRYFSLSTSNCALDITASTTTYIYLSFLGLLLSDFASQQLRELPLLP